MDNNSLVICNNVGKVLDKQQEDIHELYRKNNNGFFYRLVRKICLMINLFPEHWFSSWYKMCSEYKCVVLFEVKNAKYIIRYINKRYPTLRVILWFWNSIDIDSSVIQIYNSVKGLNCEIWSYNRSDCKKYGFRYNTQFYSISSKRLLNYEIDTDVYFLGADKNRSEILSKLIERFNAGGLRHTIILTSYKGSVESLIPYSKPISYEENIERIQKSKAIIDIVDTKKDLGNTLRPFEASYFHKKLITNDIKVKELKFYNPANIFILGVDDISKICDFVNSDYVEIDEAALSYYSFREWKDRFVLVNKDEVQE